MREVRRIGVVGAGQMGTGIAQVCAVAGFEVWLQDVVPAQLERARATIERYLRRDVEKGRRSAKEVEEALARIHFQEAMPEGMDLIIEAVPEEAELKKEVFRRLAERNPEAIWASNTSSISITELATAVPEPARFLGLHFFNPVPVMALVEIIAGERTAEPVLQWAEKFARTLGKTPVRVQDVPGFVSNRVLMVMINEAIWCLYEGVASREAIDTVMKLGMRHPMGPLELADFIGLDTVLHILEVLHRGYGDPKYRPCPLLVRMVRAGKLGRKSGEGFYSYKEG